MRWIIHSSTMPKSKKEGACDAAMIFRVVEKGHRATRLEYALATS
jgi:hypothetical protein